MFLKRNFRVPKKTKPIQFRVSVEEPYQIKLGRQGTSRKKPPR